MSLVVAQSMVLLIGIADLIGVIIMASIHSLQSRTLLLDIALAFQLPHLFVWFGMILSSSGSFSKGFLIMIFSTTIVASVCDIISIIIRLWDGSTSSIAIIELAMSIAFIIVDIAGMIMLWILSIISFDPQKKKSGMGWATETKRTILPILTILEMLFSSALFILFAAGLNRSPIYTRILSFEAAHIFIWILHRGVSGGDGTKDRFWIRVAWLSATILTMSGIVSLILRIYYEITGSDEPLGISLTYFSLINGWIQLTLGVLLLAVSAVQ